MTCSTTHAGRPLGKAPARKGAVSFHFNDYTHSSDLWWDWVIQLIIAELFGPQPVPVYPPGPNPVPPVPAPPAPPTPSPPPVPVLPSPPTTFGLDHLPPVYGMQGNDQAGDCVEAGAVHEILTWTTQAGDPARFDSTAALNLYTQWTGYSPSSPSSDQGTDMSAAASIRRKQGITDATGRKHQLGAYLALTAGDPDELAKATYLFGCTGIGVQFPQEWETAFDNGQPWDTLTRPTLAGGHYVPVIGRRANGNFVCVTWGELQEITPRGYRQFCDEAIAYINADLLGADGLSPLGFDMDQLRSDLSQLG